ncbi:MAG: hypothetical protein LBD29_06155 [Treponema sp.]|nr:hypothetical protein [Treponema sp.]
MKNKYFIMAGLFSIALAVGCLSSCDNSGDDSGGGNGGGNGMGTVTISGLPAGFNNGKINHNQFNGTHTTLVAYTLNAGQMTSGVLDNTGSSSYSNGSIVISVQGINGGTSYGFTNGTYNITFTVNNADNNTFNKQFVNVPVNFSGSAGTVAYDQNAVHWQ